MSDPGQIWLLSFKILLDCLDEDGIRFQRTATAGLPEGKDPFHPVVVFFRACSLKALLPQESEADHPFRETFAKWLRCGTKIFFASDEYEHSSN